MRERNGRVQGGLMPPLMMQQQAAGDAVHSGRARMGDALCGG